MSTQAKFFVASVTINAGGGQQTGQVKLAPVSRGAVNSRWASATPAGSMDMYITNPSAFVWFKDRLGKELRITIEEFVPNPSDHAFQPRPDREEARESHIWGAELCLECGFAQEDHAG